MTSVDLWYAEYSGRTNAKQIPKRHIYCKGYAALPAPKHVDVPLFITLLFINKWCPNYGFTKLNTIRMSYIVRRALNRSVLASSLRKSSWSLGALNHVAIAVPDLDEATAFYRDVLKAEVTGKDDLPEHGVTTG